MDPEGSLTYSQESTTDPILSQMNPVKYKVKYNKELISLVSSTVYAV
jgi:hypothetical protein